MSLAVCAFRLPNETKRYIFSASRVRKVTDIPNSPGFLFAPFQFDGSFRFIVFENALESLPSFKFMNIREDKVSSNLTKDEYRQYIETIKEFIGSDPQKKIVASRRKIIKINNEVDVNLLFEILCQTYPAAYIFLISTPEFGTWVGASPELLLKKENEIIESVALAGTKIAHSNECWNEKNLNEQQIVADYISAIFQQNGFTPKVSDRQTLLAGPVEHLCTRITAPSKNGHVAKLLKELYPTPALCGYPKEVAMKLILDKEKDKRSLYGGFSGPVFENGNFSFYVTLRCISLIHDKITAFAGGGITGLSDPEEEWMETERKLNTMTEPLSRFMIIGNPESYFDKYM